MVKNLPAMQETWILSPGQEYPLEKEMATHSSILAWRIPCPWGCKELDMTEWLSLSLSRTFLCYWDVKSGSSETKSNKDTKFFVKTVAAQPLQRTRVSLELSAPLSPSLSPPLRREVPGGLGGLTAPLFPAANLSNDFFTQIYPALALLSGPPPSYEQFKKQARNKQTKCRNIRDFHSSKRDWDSKSLVSNQSTLSLLLTFGDTAERGLQNLEKDPTLPQSSVQPARLQLRFPDCSFQCSVISGPAHPCSKDSVAQPLCQRFSLLPYLHFTLYPPKSHYLSICETQRMLSQPLSPNRFPQIGPPAQLLKIIGIIVLRGLSQSMWPATTMHHNLGDLNHGNLLLTALEAGKSKVKMPADSVLGEGPSPDLQMVAFLWCAHREAKRERALFSPPLLPTALIPLCPVPPPPRPDLIYLPTASLQNTITLWVRVSIYEFAKKQIFSPKQDLKLKKV